MTSRRPTLAGGTESECSTVASSLFTAIGAILVAHCAHPLLPPLPGRTAALGRSHLFRRDGRPFAATPMILITIRPIAILPFREVSSAPLIRGPKSGGTGIETHMASGRV